RREDAACLRHVAKAAMSAGSARQAGDVGRTEADAAVIAPRLACKRGEQRRLAHAIAAEDGKPCPGGNGKADALGNAGRAVTGGKIFDLKRRGCHWHSSRDRPRERGHPW